MNQKLIHVGAVRLVGWHRDVYLHGADDAAVAARRQQHDIAARDLVGNAAKKRRGGFARVRVMKFTETPPATQSSSTSASSSTAASASAPSSARISGSFKPPIPASTSPSNRH
jgi:hypothetical protein